MGTVVYPNTRCPIQYESNQDFCLDETCNHAVRPCMLLVVERGRGSSGTHAQVGPGQLFALKATDGHATFNRGVRTKYVKSRSSYMIVVAGS